MNDEKIITWRTTSARTERSPSACCRAFRDGTVRDQHGQRPLGVSSPLPRSRSRSCSFRSKAFSSSTTVRPRRLRRCRAPTTRSTCRATRCGAPTASTSSSPARRRFTRRSSRSKTTRCSTRRTSGVHGREEAVPLRSLPSPVQWREGRRRRAACGCLGGRAQQLLSKYSPDGKVGSFSARRTATCCCSRTASSTSCGGRRGGQATTVQHRAHEFLA